MSESEVIRLAAAAEKGSEHPLGEAVVRYAEEQGVEFGKPAEFEAVSGRGVRVVLGRHKVLLGNRRLMAEEKVGIQPFEDKISSLEHDGKTVMVATVDSVPVGLIAVADTLKESSKEAVEDLKKMGWR